MTRRAVVGWLATACVALGTAPAPAQTRTLPLRVSALLAEPVSGKIYAALPSDAGATGNSVMAIDPVTLATTAPVFVGSDPRALAASDDGQYLYVGFAGSSAVRRFDIASGSAGPVYPLRHVDSPPSIEYAVRIAVAPGHPELIVVGQSTQYSSSMHLVAYDGGVARPLAPATRFESFVFVDATTLLAATTRDIYRLRLDASGLQVDGQRAAAASSADLVAASGGLAYAAAGVVEAASLQELRYLSAGPPFVDHGLRLPVPAHGRLYRLREARLTVHSLETFDILDTIELDARHGQPRSIVALGGGVAYHTDLPRVVFVGDFSAPPPTPPPPPGPAGRVDLTGCVACLPGQAFRAAATLTNTGSAPVRVEVKAQMTRLYGNTFDLSPFGGRHAEVDLLPGTRTVTLLEGIVPPLFNLFGEWRVEMTVVDPVSGRTYAASSRVFTIK